MPIEPPEIMNYNYQTLLKAFTKILLKIYQGDKDKVTKILKLYRAQVQEALSTMCFFHN